MRLCSGAFNAASFLSVNSNPTAENLPAQRLLHSSNFNRLIQNMPRVRSMKATKPKYPIQEPKAETYVAFAFGSNDPAWKGVPIRLVTGKALHEKRSYVSVEYRDGTEDVLMKRN